MQIALRDQPTADRAEAFGARLISGLALLQCYFHLNIKHTHQMHIQSILDAWRLCSKRQLSKNLIQNHKPIVRKHHIQQETESCLGTYALHNPEQSTDKNGNPVEPLLRARALQGLPHQASGGSKIRPASFTPCRFYSNNRHKSFALTASGQLATSQSNCSRGQPESATQDSRGPETLTRRSQASHSNPNVQEPSSQAPHHALSTSRITFSGIFKNISQVDFPAGRSAPTPPPPGPSPKRTAEDRRRSEAVLKTPIGLLRNYVSTKVIEKIKKSPYYVHDEDTIVLRCHQHQKQERNESLCNGQLIRLLQNVESEIGYRESVGQMKDSQ